MDWLSETGVRGQLLASKLRIASSPPAMVSRPRLAERMDSVGPAGVLILTAPPGFGKTTLLRQWRAGESRPPAWLTLDPMDNDPTRFWSYLIGALRTVSPGFGESFLELLVSPQPPPVGVLLTPLANEMARLAEDTRVVLDDYHCIQSVAIHEGLSFLIDHIPPGVRIAIASRTAVPLRVGRLRAQGRLVELDSSDLRFNLQEAAAFLERATGLELSSEQIATLESRTEGWIAGLQLAVLSMRGRKDIEGFIASFGGSQRYVVEYLAEEVLRNQPPSVQAFLMETSIVDSLSGPLCESITGTGDGQRTLERLEESNLFIVPLDEKRSEYRYHHLFADYLRDVLHRSRPHLEPVLHRRAAAWFEKEGRTGEAIAHLLLAGDFVGASRSIEEAIYPSLMRGEVATVQGWLEALPDGVRRASMRLMLGKFWAHMVRLERELAETAMSDLELTLDAAPVSTAEMADEARGELAAARAGLALLSGDFLSAEKHANEAFRLVPSTNSFLHSVAILSSGFADQLRGDPESASRRFLDANLVGRSVGNLPATLVSLGKLGDLSLDSGQLGLAEGYYRQALGLCGEGDEWPMAVLSCRLGMARLLLERNDLDGSMTQLEIARRYCRQLGVLGVVSADAILSLLMRARGDIEGAIGILTPLVEVVAGIHTHAGDLIAAMLVRLQIAKGDLLPVRSWLAQRVGAPSPQGPGPQRLLKLTEIRARIALSETETALALIEEQLPAGEGVSRLVIDLMTVKALALRVRGDRERALSVLLEALSLAEPEGFVRAFADEGEPIADLLRMGVSQYGRTVQDPSCPSLEYLRRVLAACAGEDADERWHGLDRGIEGGNRQQLPESLSEREMQVLKLVCAGRSNLEIADELVIAEGTVKRHVHSILGKLEAANRVQAVTRAQQLGLV